MPEQFERRSVHDQVKHGLVIAAVKLGIIGIIVLLCWLYVRYDGRRGRREEEEEEARALQLEAMLARRE